MMFNLNFSFLLIPSCQLSVGLWGHESAANPHISEHRKYLQLQKNIICQLLWLKILFPPQIFPLSTNNKSNLAVLTSILIFEKHSLSLVEKRVCSFGVFLLMVPSCEEGKLIKIHKAQFKEKQYSTNISLRTQRVLPVPEKF